MNQRRKEKNWLEWTVFTFGLLLVAALVLYLAYDIWTARTGPPEIEVKLGEATLQGDHYVLLVELRNSGHEVAEQVQVEVVLRRGEQTEEANFVIQHLPRGSTRHGAVTFATDPAVADRLEARVLGYQQP